MSTPLGPMIANIFVGFYEQDLISLINGPNYYVRYVNDIFCAFDNKAGIFYKVLVPSMHFTCENKNNSIFWMFWCTDWISYRCTGNHPSWGFIPIEIPFCSRQHTFNLIKVLSEIGYQLNTVETSI